MPNDEADRPLDSAAICLLQYVDDAVTLDANRTFLTTAPHGAVRYLRRFDDRLVAHLDGISIAGQQGKALLDPALDPVSAGSLLVTTVSAMKERLDRLVDLAQAAPAAVRGSFSAFGWVERETSGVGWPGCSRLKSRSDDSPESRPAACTASIPAI
jgi:hypothetical protein